MSPTKSFGAFCALGVVVLSLAATCNAEPARWVDHDGNEHFYDFVPTGPMHYVEARKKAAQMMYNGKRGHLATITTEGEHEFVLREMPRRIMNTFSESSKRNAWIGLERAGENALQWVTGEGALDARWCEGEPNNRAGDEFFMHVFVFDDEDWCWNDISGSNDYVQGFLVEYDQYLDMKEGQEKQEKQKKPPRVPWEDKSDGSGSGSPPPNRASPSSGSKEPILTTSIDLDVEGQIVTKKIKTYEGDDPYVVASRFAAENKLAPEHASQLAEHIQAELNALAAERGSSVSASEKSTGSWDEKLYAQQEGALKDDGTIDPTHLDPPVLFNLTDEQRQEFATCLTECIRAIPDENSYDVKPIVNCSKKCTGELKQKQRSSK